MNCGYVALVGRPNVGKSTLFNALVGQRLSIVTAKPQTTRGRILGILTYQKSQMVFLDTPGLLEPKYKLHESMGKQIEQANREADITLLLVDANKPTDRSELVKNFLSATQTPVLPVLNKIDLLSEDRVKQVQDLISGIYNLPKIVPISALANKNINNLLESIRSQLPVGPQLYPEEMIAEQPERFFAAELIRESAFEHLEDELPYSINVVIDDFIERDDRKTYVRAILYVERESQKGIVIGNKGTRIQSIGKKARKGIEDLIDSEIYLELKVKVRTGWRNKEKDLHEFGYL